MAVYCFECNKVFTHQSNYNRHRRNIHGLQDKVIIEYEYEITLFKCLECRSSFKKNEYLRHHLSQKHNFKFEYEDLSFDTYEEFQNWLSIEEKANNIEFEKLTGVKRSNNAEIKKIYLNCVRSGKAPEQISERKRVFKSQGSKKLNCYCTSQIIVLQKGDKCEVQYYKTHYGHNSDIEHLRIPKSEKDIIASKLLMGVSTEKILDNFRENIISEEIHRSDIITKKDIHNIKQTYNVDIRNGCRHTEDVVSVDIWIKEVEVHDNNPVVFYKKQGELSESHLMESDFCLILMNSIQANMLKKFGSNIICLDNTHGLNPYDFELTTLMVIDEFGEGFPVACMFSNRKDTYINELFFTHIKSKVGSINPETFMTDITNTYFNAWCLVMGLPVNRLFCSWHVDRAWQNNLSKVKDSEKRKWVYKTLKYLKRKLDRIEFEEEYAAFISLLLNEDNTKEMGLYLIDHYSNCTKAWCYCYRKQCGISTNMHIENMHKNLKYTYLEGKKVKRLDKSLHLVQKLIRDKIIDRLIKLTKGKTTKHSQQINMQHRLALSLKADIISENTNQFLIKKPSNKDHYVTRLHDNPCCNLKCVYCDVCIHTFECTCLDFNIKNTICRHIHYICLEKYSGGTYQAKNKIEDNDELNMLARDSTLCLPSKHSKEKIINDIESNLLEVISKIKSENHSKEQLLFILEKSKNMKNVMNIGNDNFLIVKDTSRKQEPSNKNITKQSFYSTKKRKASSNNNKKPNPEEQQIIKETLTRSEVVSNDSWNDHFYL